MVGLQNHRVKLEGDWASNEGGGHCYRGRSYSMSPLILGKHFKHTNFISPVTINSSVK